jgi:hypothetical protein
VTGRGVVGLGVSDDGGGIGHSVGASGVVGSGDSGSADRVVAARSGERVCA